MITLPTIDVPTAIVAVVVTVVGNWLKDEYFRWRRKIESSKSEKIRWYKETIQICERVKTTHSLLEEFDSVRQDSYIDSVMDDAEERVRDYWEETDLPHKEKIGEEPPEELIKEMNSAVESQFEDVFVPQMSERITEDVSNHFIELRDHFASRPREISEEQFPIENLMTEILIIEVTTDEIPNRELSKDSIKEDANTIIQTCEQNIKNLQPFHKRVLSSLVD